MDRGNIVIMLLTSILGACVFVLLMGNFSGDIGPFEIHLSVDFVSEGITEVVIPPIGKIRAHTHLSPMKIVLKLNNINLDELERLLDKNINRQKLLEGYKKDIKLLVKVFAVKLLFLGCLGACFAAFLFNYKKPKFVVLSGFIGILVIGLLLATTYYTYDVQAFKDPEYVGIIKGAPWMLGLAEKAVAEVEKLGDKLQLMAKNVYQLFEKINTLEPIELKKTKIKVLHVSDIHNNPATMDFIEEVVKSFQVDFIIDTGDITDYGTPIEAKLLERIRSFKVPYLFVPGNHDSPEIVKKMKDIDNVVVLNRTAINIDGLTVFGVPDPASKTNQIVLSQEYSESQYVDEIQKDLRKNDESPIDILAFHDPKLAKIFANKAPVILFGHTHALGIEKTNRSILINAGTSGGAGIRGLLTNKDIPYSVVLLYFSMDNNLLAADIIKVRNLEKGLVLERIVFDKKEGYFEENQEFYSLEFGR